MQRELLGRPNPPASRLKDTAAKLSAIRDEIRGAEDRLARNARVLGCALARLATSVALVDQRIDVVVVDEASMASVPFVALASIHAKRTAVFAGDFRQLPPIVLADEPPVAREWLGRHVFDHAGITDRVTRGGPLDPRVVMLKTQYRMHPDIARRVSSIYYNEQLRDDSQIAERVRPARGGGPYPNVSAQLVDISDLGPFCPQGPEELGLSRFNPVSALVGLMLASEALGDQGLSVGIITPYRLQARLLRVLAKDLGIDRATISTVHRFQGGEVDIAIVDLTTAESHRSLGTLLGGDTWSTAGRLLNVAISRPRGKLVVVAACRHIYNHWSRNPTEAHTQALYQVLASFTARRMKPQQLRDWIDALDPVAGLSPIQISEGGLFKGRAVHAVGAAVRDLFLAVRKESQPAPWMRRSAGNGARVIVRGQSLSSEWSRLPVARMFDAQVTYNSAFVDRDRFVLEIPGFMQVSGGSGATAIIRLPDSAQLLADLLELVPPGENPITQHGGDLLTRRRAESPAGETAAPDGLRSPSTAPAIVTMDGPSRSSTPPRKARGPGRSDRQRAGPRDAAHATARMLAAKPPSTTPRVPGRLPTKWCPRHSRRGEPKMMGGKWALCCTVDRCAWSYPL